MTTTPEKQIRTKRNDYSNSKIYKITNDINDLIFIGSTIQPLSKALSTHKQRSKIRKMRFYIDMKMIGPEHFKILLIENHPCNSKEELKAHEDEVIKRYSKDTIYNFEKVNDEIVDKLQDKTTELLNEHQKNRFLITDDEENKRLRIRWIEKGQKKEKTFRYVIKPYEQVLEDAKKFREGLIELHKL